MNFNEKSIIEKQKKIRSPKNKLISKGKLGLLHFITIAFVSLILVCSVAGAGIIKSLMDTAPSIEDVDVIPKGYSTTVYDMDGNQIQKLVGSDANRVYVTIDKIPKSVQDAFVAIEDSRFWKHDGIDVQGIFRAAVSGLTQTDGFDQGASTITQQLLKNQVFNGGNETTFAAKFQRKIQEQYLAIQLEDRMDKKQILEYYLNTINLGQNTLGVQAASSRYFNKDISDLSISEAAVLASITQNPSQYDPIVHPQDNAKRRSVVLTYMKEQGYITEAEYNEALEDKVYESIASTNSKQSKSRKGINSYFVDSLIDQVATDLKEELGYTETQAYNAIYREGLQIYSTQNKALQKICDSTIADDSFYPAAHLWALSYSLTVASSDGSQKNYNEQSLKQYFQQERNDADFNIFFSDREEAKKLVAEYRNSLVGKEDTVLSESISFLVQPQVSFVLMDQSNGQVKAIVGGRGKKTGNQTLNRATDTYRQPGSTFKILSTYLPALDAAGMTLATVQDDAPYQYPDTNTPVRNWTGSSSYQGLTSLREAIIHSMNIVTVKTFEQVTPQTGFNYLKNLGFTSLVENMTTENGNVYSDVQLPTALGGLTNGVNNLELTAAFASIANKGAYIEPVFYTKILDHDGNVLLEKKPDTRQVMKESTAWLLTDAMEDVVSEGTGTIVQFDEVDMPVAGKTGTTSNDVDIWFVGYTPYFTAGIWGGYDENFSQEDTTYHKYIWKSIMQKVHQKLNLSRVDFEKPDSIVSARICTKCGKLATTGLCDKAVGGSCIKTEYFDQSSLPTEHCTCHVKYKICKKSNKLATDDCPTSSVITKVYLQKEEGDAAKDDETGDAAFMPPAELLKSSCPVHGKTVNLFTD